MSLPGTASLASSLSAFYGDLGGSELAARRVGWESDAGHLLRLGVAVELLAPVASWPSVLDAGCGEGRLLPALRAAGFRGSYLGEDLLPRPVERAVAAHAADSGASFQVRDVLAGGPPAAAVVCAGTLNTRVDAMGPGPGPDLSHEAYVLAALDALLARSDEVLVVSLAILDRHPGGVGIGRVRLGVVLDHLRARRPVVTVQEDGPPGEATFLAANHRRAAVSRRLAVPGLRAAYLLEAGDPAGALAVLATLGTDGGDPVLRGRALAATGALVEAEALLAPLCAPPEPEAALALAEVLWRLGRRAEAVALLEAVADRSDEAAAHLAMALLALGRPRDAARAVARVGDAWMRRELERRLPTR